MSYQNTWTHRMPLLLLTVVTAMGSVVTTDAQEDGFYPNTKSWGQAAVQYKDDDIHAVAAYYYSQRHHRSRWLLIEAAVSTTRNMTIDRKNVTLVAPGGRTVTLPTQARVAQQVPGIRPVVQSASSTRHGVLTYFSQRGSSEPMRLFSLSSGAVLTNFVTDQYHVAHGDLFFESPTGTWEKGTYSLVIERDGARAVLPIRLE